MHRRTFIRRTGITGLIAMAVPSEIIQALPQNGSLSYDKSFLDPPFSAYPHAYWFWMNGHVTKQGITLDLEAMKSIGVSGVFNFDGGTGIPKGPVEYLSAEWIELKKHAIEEADRLGIAFTMHNCPGWSSSGGPWITPELGMQQVTWSETYVRGGKLVSSQLPVPFTKLNYYRDVVVLAFPSLEGEAAMQTPRVTSNKGPVDLNKINGQDHDGVILQPERGGQPAWLKFDFSESYTASSITFLVAALTNDVKEIEQAFSGIRTSVLLESSDDGYRFSTVTVINTGFEAELLKGDKFITFDFQATKARFFRLVSDAPRRFSQIRFSSITRLNNFMEKAAYRFMFSAEGTSNLFKENTQVVPGTSIVDFNSILIITQYADQDGYLKWHAPYGNWTILRIGFTPTGMLNRAAPDTGIGLECDKFNRRAIDFHFNKMMEFFLPQLEHLGQKGMIGLEIDSYEAGMQNWTPDLPTEFHCRRGYDLLKMLPALTGRVVGSVDYTERFFWDFRRTLADLMADHYYGRFHELCRQHGFTSYIEPYDKGPMEEMQIGSRVDVNMGEFWNGLFSTLQGNIPIRRTPKLAASIAHTNAQKIVGAEAFTSEPESSRWQEYPFAMKALGDKMFTKGINRMVFHRFAHQPHPTASPGMTMGPWGIHFDRTNTWWNEGKAWMQYLARCQHMLQQGLFVADLVYFTGEESNFYTRVNPGELNHGPPEGYDYDLINAESIIKRVQIKNGKIVLPDGMAYSMLVLQDYKAISLSLLQKLRELVLQGMFMVGSKPERSLGLSDLEKGDHIFRNVVDELWGNIDGNKVTKNKVGRGMVIWGQSLSDVLQGLKVQPDFSYTSRSGDAPVHYIHRKAGKDHIYFLCNERRTSEDLVCTFRVQNMQPELRDAATGRMISLPLFELLDDGIRLPIHLDPYGSIFVVFRSPAQSHGIHSIEKDNKVILSTRPYPKRQRRIYKEVKDNFTISLWAKPEINVMLNTSIHMEMLKHPYTDYYAIFPPPGCNLYGEGQATCGLTVGRNGVAVWENCSGNPVLVLAASTPISGWSHVALVYKDGVPSVFVSGRWIQSGQRSSQTVHPGIGEAFLHEGASYYNGDMSEPELFSEPLSNEQIQLLAGTQPQRPKSIQPVIEAYEGMNSRFLITQNGNYKVHKSNGQIISFQVREIDKPFELKGPWLVQFPPEKRAPEHLILPELVSLHKHKDDGVKYFSGTCTYTKEFTIQRRVFSTGKHFFLDLGSVEVIAEVILNGMNLGILWKRPYRIEITNAIKAGQNKLSIRVTNLWPNRLIGDEHLPEPDQFAEETGSGSFERIVGGGIQKVPEWYIQGKPKPENGRIAFTTWKHYTKVSPLLESGLIGPVILQTARVKFI